eukprot:SAG11_NODE_42_length_20827_cov_9.289801_10_plen_265_part_00
MEGVHANVASKAPAAWLPAAAAVAAPHVPPPQTIADGFVAIAVALAVAIMYFPVGPPAQAVVVALAVAWLAREAAGLLACRSMRGETVLITGAGSGLGRLIAHRFAIEGCRLVLWDLDAEGVATTCAECKALKAEAFAQNVDVSDPNAVSAAAKLALQGGRRVDCLINNAGIVSGLKLLAAPPRLVSATIDVNTKALVYTTQAFLPGMLERGYGRVVTIASMAGLLGVAGMTDCEDRKKIIMPQHYLPNHLPHGLCADHSNAII